MHKFYFECPQCGRYEVEREVLEKVLTPDLRVLMNTKSRDPKVAGFVAKFEKSCQKYTPEGDATIQLVALKKRTIH